MLIDEKWFQEKRQQILTNNFTIQLIKWTEYPEFIETRITKLLLYYVTIQRQLKNNGTQYKNCEYVGNFNEDLEQTYDESVDNSAFLKYHQDETKIKITFKENNKPNVEIIEEYIQ